MSATTIQSAPEQVEDVPELLDIMIADQNRADSIYHPAARWKRYSERLIDFIKANDLRDFRRIEGRDEEGARALRSFGAVDLLPNSQRFQPARLIAEANSATRGPSAKGILELSNSRVGNPGGFEHSGNFYCLNWLNFYMRYAYVSRFIDFDQQTVVEIGPGSGKQAEMLKKAHPDLTILLFDIPPQLYVCNQYLKKVFAEEVVPYEQTRTFRSFTDLQARKIHVLPNWQMPLLHGQSFDLLWNTASFQEMVPEIVRHYMSMCQGAGNLFLMYLLQPTHKEGANYGGSGVIAPQYLGRFAETHRENARLTYDRREWSYYDSFWRRNTE